MVERMGRITAQLKKFARKTPVQSLPTPVGAVIADALFLLDSRIRNEGVALTLDLPEPSPLALCEGNRLEQVLVNLLSNALDAMKDAPVRRLDIVVGTQARWVSIAVGDTGCGIDDAVMPRLFEPFFTTKEQGVGLGLGLAISAGIVRDFGGTLHAANRGAAYGEPAHAGMPGACFTIQLPAAREAARDAN
jgi:two-component system C4-dicarboxylate transport sensor histidine kinase DctB